MNFFQSFCLEFPWLLSLRTKFISSTRYGKSVLGRLKCREQHLIWFCFPFVLLQHYVLTFFLSLFLLLNYFWNFVCLLYCTVVIMHAVLLSLPIFIPDGLCCSFVLIKMPMFPFLIRFFLVSDPYYWQLLMHPVFILHSLSFPWAGILCYRVYSSTITASPPLNCILGRF